MRDRQGGIIGATVTPTTSAASGVWTLREAERFQRGGTWPLVLATPLTISTLKAWYDASAASVYSSTSGGSVVTSNGSQIARWEDLSGNGYHATQATSANCPTLTTSVQNGKNVVSFNGTSAFLQHSASVLAPATTFAVAKLNSTGTSGYEGLYAACAPNTTIGAGVSARTSGSANWGFYIDSWKPSSYSLQSSAKVIVAVANTSSPDRFRTNGVSQNITWTSRTLFTDNTSRQSIGGENGLAGGNMNGYICEIIVYSSVLSDAEISTIESYLTAKWGIT